MSVLVGFCGKRRKRTRNDHREMKFALNRGTCRLNIGGSTRWKISMTPRDRLARLQVASNFGNWRYSERSIEGFLGARVWNEIFSPYFLSPNCTQRIEPSHRFIQNSHRLSFLKMRSNGICTWVARHQSRVPIGWRGAETREGEERKEKAEIN